MNFPGKTVVLSLYLLPGMYVNNPRSNIVYAAQDLYDDWLRAIGEKTALNPTPKSCECGGDAVKAAFHSDYCPKRENA